MSKYKQLMQKPFWFTTIITFFAGTAIHLFGLVNVLHNYDDISVQPFGVGTTLSSGRWLLEIFVKMFQGRLKGNYNLPYFNGIIFIAFVALAAGFLVLTFKIKNRWHGLLMGIILISFPSAASTLFFKYTATYYGFAILLSVLAVWSLKQSKFGFPVSCLCTAFALAIYQAYLPVTASIFVLLLIKEAMEEKKITFGKIIGRGVYYCASMAVGLVLYYLILQIFLKHYGLELSNYQGISDMGNLNIAELPQLIKSTFVSFCLLPIKDYCDLAQTSLIKFMYIVLGIISIILVIWNLIKSKKNILVSVMIVVLGAVFPIAVNLIAIMCPNSKIYTLMVYSFAIVLCVPVILMDLMPEKSSIPKLQTAVKAVIIAAVLSIVCSYTYLTNVNYTAMYYTNRQTENYLNSMVVQIRMTENYDAAKKWAFIGKNIEDPLISNPWGKAPMYGGNSNTYINAYSRNRWISRYLGYNVPLEKQEIVDELKNSDEVKNMPCWPSEGSIKVIDNTVVIKLQEE